MGDVITVDYVPEIQMWVTPHPVYSNYGIAFDARSGQTQMRLVNGTFDGSRVQVVTANAPIPVLSWYYVTLESILESVNNGDTSIFDSLTKIEYKEENEPH